MRFGHFLFGISILALALGILALTRPQKGTQSEEVLTDSVDIVIALDASGSMAAEDFEPRNRFAVAKLVVGKFVDALSHDRAGLVVFAARAYTRCPLTLDYGALQNVLNSVELGTHRRRDRHRQCVGYQPQSSAREQSQIQGHHPGNRRG